MQQRVSRPHATVLREICPWGDAVAQTGIRVEIALIGSAVCACHAGPVDEHCVTKVRRPCSFTHAVSHACIVAPPQSLEVVWPQPPAPCPTLGRTVILVDDFEPSSKNGRSRSSPQDTTGGLNTTIWSPTESYGDTVRLGDASDTCGQALYGNGSLVFYQGGGSLQLQDVIVPADATWSVHVGWACTTWYDSGTELALEYYDPGEVGPRGLRHWVGQKGSQVHMKVA